MPLLSADLCMLRDDVRTRSHHVASRPDVLETPIMRAIVPAVARRIDGRIHRLGAGPCEDLASVRSHPILNKGAGIDRPIRVSMVSLSSLVRASSAALARPPARRGVGLPPDQGEIERLVAFDLRAAARLP